MTYEQFLGALCLWREARGESIETRRGIWHVIQNRAKDGRWPRTIPGVILQHAQFSSFLQSDPNCIKFPVEGQGADWTAWQECCDIVTTPVSDPTEGANHYESMPPGQHPSWLGGSHPVLTIGNTRFYRL